MNISKKLLINILFLIFISSFSIPVFAEDFEDDISENEKIAAIGFGKVFSSDPKKDITNLFKKHDDYTKNKDIKKIKLLYSDNFINNDGFDLEEFMKAMKDGFDTYNVKNITSKIESISVNDDFAIVHVIESSEGETIKSVDDMGGHGLVLTNADTYYSLKRDGKKWKITSANIMDENCSILYGNAKNVYFALNVPSPVKAGSEYSASLSFAPIKETIVLASLSAEPIVYPMPITKETYKNVKGDGLLERFFTANANNCNEYVIASISLTVPKMTNDFNFNIELSGTAFVVRRVNVFNTIKNQSHKKGLFEKQLDKKQLSKKDAK